jgi:hypothetical protein
MRTPQHEALIKELSVLEPKIDKLERQYSYVRTNLFKERILTKLDPLYKERRKIDSKIRKIVDGGIK